MFHELIVAALVVVTCVVKSSNKKKTLTEFYSFENYPLSFFFKDISRELRQVEAWTTAFQLQLGVTPCVLMKPRKPNRSYTKHQCFCNERCGSGKMDKNSNKKNNCCEEEKLESGKKWARKEETNEEKRDNGAGTNKQLWIIRTGDK